MRNKSSINNKLNNNFLFQSGAESPCNCEECILEDREREKAKTMDPQNTKTPKKENNRVVDVLVHDSPPEIPQFFQSVTSPPYVTTTQPYGSSSQPYVSTSQPYNPTSAPYVSPTPSFSPPPPGFVVAPIQRFHTGGNVEDLLGEVSAQNSPTIQTTYIQQNSVFMCNTKRILQKQCCCQNNEQNGVKTPPESPKHYVTEKNIELTYDYPRGTPIPSTSKKSNDDLTTTTEVASTVVFVERRIPVKPKKFDFFFRSRSAPVGDNEEPIYATVNKLPKRLRRMELANLEKEIAYKTGEPDSSTRTDLTLKTDSESQAPHIDDDTSRSEREKSTIPRPDSPKAKKRKRFSLTFKKRERKRREKEGKNGVKNGVQVGESDNERLIDEVTFKFAIIFN